MSLQARIPAHYTRWSVDLTLAGRPARLRCEAPGLLGGVPHGLDHDLLQAVLTLFVRAGGPADGAVRTSLGALLTVAGLRLDGHHYRAARLSLLRLSAATYSLVRPVDPVPPVSFRLIERLHLDRPAVCLHLTPELARSWRVGQHAPADARVLAQLPGPLPRALYRLLDACRSSAQLSFSVPLGAWGDTCKLVDRKPAKVRRALEGAHAPLIACGYLREVEYEGRGGQQRVTYHFGVASQATTTDPEVLAAVTRGGVAPGVARALIERFGEARVAERTRRCETLLAGGYRARNPAALLVDVIRDDTGKYPAVVEASDPAPRLVQQEARREQLQREQRAQDAERQAEWTMLNAGQQRERALKTLTLLLGARLTPHISQRVQARLERGDLQPDALLQDALRAAAEHRLDDFARALGDKTLIGGWAEDPRPSHLPGAWSATVYERE